ncbi:MAG: hypothetical protein ACRBB2_04920 [Nitrosopumilus sp.]
MHEQVLSSLQEDLSNHGDKTVMKNCGFYNESNSLTFDSITACESKLFLSYKKCRGLIACSHVNSSDAFCLSNASGGETK